ncbi:MAG: hypothetical protein ACK4H7_04845, partial [Acidilobaceae archaeon]
SISGIGVSCYGRVMDNYLVYAVVGARGVTVQIINGDTGNFLLLYVSKSVAEDPELRYKFRQLAERDEYFRTMVELMKKAVSEEFGCTRRDDFILVSKLFTDAAGAIL